MKPVLKCGLAVATLFTVACAPTTQSSESDGADCQSEAVIMVVSGTTLDAQRMGAYAQALGASGLYPESGGYYLNNPRPIDVFDGDVPENFVTLMVRFPSHKVARDFWDSEIYQNEIKPLRQNPSAGDYFVTVYAEADLPDYMVGKVGASAYACD